MKHILDSIHVGLKAVAELPAILIIHTAAEGLPAWLKIALGLLALVGALYLPIFVGRMLKGGRPLRRRKRNRRPLKRGAPNNI